MVFVFVVAVVVVDDDDDISAAVDVLDRVSFSKKKYRIVEVSAMRYGRADAPITAHTDACFSTDGTIRGIRNERVSFLECLRW